MRVARVKRPLRSARGNKMQVRAIAKDIGISPRKMRLVTNAVKGKSVSEALAILQFIPNAGARPVSKVIASAAANAENNYNLDPGDLYILNIVADDSFRIKRDRKSTRLNSSHANISYA